MGVAIVYTSESRSLASLEVLVHTEDTQTLAAIKWATIPVSIDESFVEIADPLPGDWRQLPAPLSTRELGSRWVAASRSVVLRVPSIVVDGEFNYLLNPRHQDFARLKIGEPRPFSFDPRLSTGIVVASLRRDDPFRARHPACLSLLNDPQLSAEAPLSYSPPTGQVSRVTVCPTPARL